MCNIIVLWEYFTKDKAIQILKMWRTIFMLFRHMIQWISSGSFLRTKTWIETKPKSLIFEKHKVIYLSLKPTSMLYVVVNLEPRDISGLNGDNDVSQRPLWSYMIQYKFEALSTGKPTFWPTNFNKTPVLLDLYDINSNYTPIIFTLSQTIVGKDATPALANKQTDWISFTLSLKKNVTSLTTV